MKLFNSFEYVGDGLKPQPLRCPVDPEASLVYRQAVAGTVLRLCQALPQSGRIGI